MEKKLKYCQLIGLIIPSSFSSINFLLYVDTRLICHIYFCSLSQFIDKHFPSILIHLKKRTYQHSKSSEAATGSYVKSENTFTVEYTFYLT